MANNKDNMISNITTTYKNNDSFIGYSSLPNPSSESSAIRNTKDYAEEILELIKSAESKIESLKYEKIIYENFLVFLRENEKILELLLFSDKKTKVFSLFDSLKKNIK